MSKTTNKIRRKAREIMEELIVSGEVLQMTNRLRFVDEICNEDKERRNDFIQEIYLMLIELCDRRPEFILEYYEIGRLNKYVAGIVVCQFYGKRNLYASKYKKWDQRRESLSAVETGEIYWGEVLYVRSGVQTEWEPDMG